MDVLEVNPRHKITKNKLTKKQISIIFVRPRVYANYILCMDINLNFVRAYRT